ncbi:MAG: tetratricopeptide repeat protein, partial [Lachnospiraceae bacterium]|nr:tetratricopeptide repeat protein [Lachnospiraceae bacterium]
MFCYNCGCNLSKHDFCTSCGVDVSLYKKIMATSNLLYNEGLEKANVRDLTGAVNSLRHSLKFNKNNIEARNLLGLVYFEMGEYVAALNEWVISKNM